MDPISSKFRLDDRVAIVTGAGGDIGKGIALCLAQAGAHVVVAELNPSSGEATAQEIRALGRRSLPVVVDVTNSEQVGNLVEATVKEFGRIDILVNNVGGNAPMMPAIRMTDVEWDKVIKRNLTSVFVCSRGVCRLMIEQKKGNVINIASAAGVRAFPGFAAYASAKAAVISFTRTLAAELARYNIRVNCILPGAVDSKATSSRTGLTALERAERAGILLGRLGYPEDIGLTALYLASDASDYLTGEAIEVKGGPPTRKGDLEAFIAKFPEL